MPFAREPPIRPRPIKAMVVSCMVNFSIIKIAPYIECSLGDTESPENLYRERLSGVFAVNDPWLSGYLASKVLPDRSTYGFKSAISFSKASKVRDCGPSESALAGSGCTSIISPSAPTATAAFARGST